MTKMSNGGLLEVAKTQQATAERLLARLEEKQRQVRSGEGTDALTWRMARVRGLIEYWKTRRQWLLARPPVHPPGPPPGS